MYPLFEKSLNSNMSGYQKSEIWKSLFKILRTLMNIEPSHIQRLFRNQNLIEILKYCLIRGGIGKNNTNSNLLTKNLIVEVIKIVRDFKTNSSNSELEGFYKRYLYDIILCVPFCNLKFTDTMRSNRKIYVFNEVAESIFKIFIEGNNKQLVKNEKLK